MNAAQVLIHGTLNTDGTLTLEHTPQLPAGRVEVLIRALPDSPPAMETWWEFLQRSYAEAVAHGHVPRTREVIDAERARVRALGDTRRQGIARALDPG